MHVHFFHLVFVLNHYFFVIISSLLVAEYKQNTRFLCFDEFLNCYDYEARQATSFTQEARDETLHPELYTTKYTRYIHWKMTKFQISLD